MRGAALDACSRTATCARGARSSSATTASCAARPRFRAGAADAGVICPIPGAPLGVALAVAGNPRYGKTRSAAGRRARGARGDAQRRRRRRAPARAHRLSELRRSRPFPSISARWSRRSTASRTRRAGSGRRSSRATSASTTNRSRDVRSHRRRSSLASAASTTSRRRASMAFKRAGSALYFVGRPEERFGGSVYAELLGIERGAAARRSTTIASSARSRSCWRRSRRDLVLAAHDVSDGGVLVALAEMAFATRRRRAHRHAARASPLDGRDGYGGVRRSVRLHRRG